MLAAVNAKIVPIALLVAVVGAGGYAVFRSDSPPEQVHPLPAADLAPAVSDDPHAGMNNPHAGMDQGQSLPPNHPPIGGNSAGGAMPPSSDEPPALAWKKPASWNEAPNPNTMRVATYRVPHVGSDTEDADVSVTRAGGGTEANITRWLGQFDKAGQETRTVKKVHGMTVTTVEVAGTYEGGGMMMGAQPASKPGWMLVGAIVETPGAPYFFKMTGPAATVKSARSAFDAMIDGATPAASGDAGGKAI